MFRDSTLTEAKVERFVKIIGKTQTLVSVVVNPHQRLAPACGMSPTEVQLGFAVTQKYLGDKHCHSLSPREGPAGRVTCDGTDRLPAPSQPTRGRALSKATHL